RERRDVAISIPTVLPFSVPPTVAMPDSLPQNSKSVQEEKPMTDSLRKVDYFYTFVPNTAGQGSKILAALAEEGVNLLAFSGFPSGRRAQLDLVPEDSAALKRAAKKLKLKLSPRKTGFLLQGDDRIGAMTETLNALANAKINITAMDAISSGDGRFASLFWVQPEAVAKAAKVIGAQ